MLHLCVGGGVLCRVGLRAGTHLVFEAFRSTVLVVPHLDRSRTPHVPISDRSGREQYKRGIFSNYIHSMHSLLSILPYLSLTSDLLPSAPDSSAASGGTTPSRPCPVASAPKAGTIPPAFVTCPPTMLVPSLNRLGAGMKAVAAVVFVR